jgi:hypothetical protein
VAQDIDPESKPQYFKKKKKNAEKQPELGYNFPKLRKTPLGYSTSIHTIKRIPNFQIMACHVPD